MNVAEITAKLPVTPDASRAWLRLRLQLLLAKLEFILSQPADGSRGSMSGYFLASTCEMAMFAAEGGLSGFASVCLQIAARIEPFHRDKRLPDPALEALGRWLLEADRYLRRPTSRVRGASLISRLNDAAWARPLSNAEQQALAAEMMISCTDVTPADTLAHTPN